MAFNFYGTFTTGQLEEFKKFSKVQERDFLARRKWLSAALQRNGIFITEYDEDGATPISYSANPGSYAAKLILAYKSLGGIPERDFLLRTSDMPVFLTRGKNVSQTPMQNPSDGYSDVFSNGRRMRGNQRFDRDVGLVVEKIKSWQLESVKRKRETLEFKIKRALDYSDQLSNEISLIDLLLDETSGKSLSDQLIKLNALLLRDGAHNLVNNMSDIFGLNIGRVQDMNFSDDYDRKDAEALR